MYHFVTPDAEGLAERRQLLDLYANIAQWSASVPLIAVQTVLLLRYLQRKYSSESSQRYAAVARSQEESGTSGSLSLKHEGEPGSNKRPWSFKTAWNSFMWWNGEEVELAESSRGALLAAACWATWLLALSVAQTGDDYLHFTKRLGIVAASQMPLHYLLSLKTPYSPLQLLTQTSNESLLMLHQLLGRVIILFFAAHVALYTNFFVLSSLLATKLTQLYILAGYSAFISFAVLGTTALGWIRHRNYRLFYILHVSLAFTVLPALWIHVSHIRIYLYQSLAIYLINQALRALATQQTSAKITPVPGSDNLVEITIHAARVRFTSWLPGNYGYVSTHQGRFILPWVRGNPFTLARIPTTSREEYAAGGKAQNANSVSLKFVVRVLAGQTRALSTLRSVVEHTIRLEGPYGDMLHGDRLLRYDRVLFVAGGIGGTFCSPLYEQLLEDLSPSKGSHRRQQVTFLWVVRRVEDVSWALPSDQNKLEGFAERLTVHVTHPNSEASRRKEHTGVADGNKRRRSHTRTPTDNGTQESDIEIELEERRNLLHADELVEVPGGRGSISQNQNAKVLTLCAGRPDIGQVVDDVFASGVGHDRSKRVAVIVCGPKSLCRSLRREVGRHVSEGREIWFWNEKFGY